MPVPQFKPHSTQIGHPGDCPCTPCHQARTFNQKLNRSGYKTRIEAGPVIAHLRLLHKTAGNSLKAVASATGLSEATVSRLLCQKVDTVYPRIANSILTTKTSDITPNRPDAELFYWRLGVLGAQGFPRSWVARRGGFETKRYHHFNRVGNHRWNALDRIWKEIDGRMADPERDGIPKSSISKAMTHARKEGFFPLAAYDNEFDKHPADDREGADLIREDRKRLDALVASRVASGFNTPEIVSELSPLYPDFDIDNAIERIRRRELRALQAVNVTRN